MSSPNLNNLIIIGCILVYIAGILFGLKKDGNSGLCQVYTNKFFHKILMPVLLPVSRFPFTSMFDTLPKKERILNYHKVLNSEIQLE